MGKLDINNREIEVRFLEINTTALIEKLYQLGADDLGEDFLEEIIFYDKELTWQYIRKKMVRIRKTKTGIFLTYKFKEDETSGMEVEEIEFQISDIEKGTAFLEALGLIAYRRQEKKRHKFLFKEIIVDIDTWPRVPTYVELEGPSEKHIREAAKLLGFDWANAVYEPPRYLIEHRYNIPVSKLRFFTFDKIE